MIRKSYHFYKKSATTFARICYLLTGSIFAGNLIILTVMVIKEDLLSL